VDGVGVGTELTGFIPYIDWRLGGGSGSSKEGGSGT
jgi:hypothetical protein